jgi:hypothetical protein
MRCFFPVIRRDQSGNVSRSPIEARQFQVVAETFSVTTFDDPPGCIVTPSKLSPASIVRFW